MSDSEAIARFHGSNIAAVSWADGDKTQVRVYTLDKEGGVRESAYDGTTWTFNKDPINNPKDTNLKAIRSSGLTAFKYKENIYVYYVASHNNIVLREVFRDSSKPLAGNWETGSLNKLNLEAGEQSGLAALAYEDKYFALFFRWRGATIRQVRRDSSGTWKEVESFRCVTRYTTSFAAVTPDPYGTAHIRLYFLDESGSLASVGVEDNGSYQPGGAEMDMIKPLERQIAAVKNEIYYLNTQTAFSEASYYGNKWHPENHPDDVHGQFGIAVTLDDSGLHRAYLNDANGQTIEYRFVRPFDKDPTARTVIPTGN